MFRLILLFCSLIPVCLSAQDTLCGRVLSEDRHPIMAAHVYLSGSPELGSYTGADGTFMLVLPSRRVAGDTLLISAMGYRTHRLSPVPVAEVPEVVLQETEYLLSAVMVKARDPISDAFLLTRQEQLDIYLNPVAAADPLRSLIALPASTNTSESANPELRGSTADRSRVWINGVPIYRPVRNTQINGIGNFSLFNTEMLQRQYVYPTNAPLYRGNSTAGAVAIETTQDLKDNYTQFSLGLANAGLFRGQRLGERSFLQAYTNRQFSDLFLKVNGKKVEDLRAFRSQDAGLNVHLEQNSGWTLDAFAYGIDEGYRVQINVLGVDGTVSSSRQRHFNVLRLRKQFEKASISLHHGFDISRSDFSFGNRDSRQWQQTWYTAFDWRRQMGERWEWQTGIVHEHSHYRFRDTVPRLFYALGSGDPVQMELDTLRARRLETYRYLRYRPGEDWLLQAALRVSWLKRPFGRYLSAQLSARHQLAPEQALLLSGGWYHSFSLPTSFDKDIRLLTSAQLAVDYDYLSTGDFHLHLAAYLKRESGQFDPDLNQLEDYRLIYGLELLAEQNFGDRWLGSIAGTWLRQRVRGNGQEWSGAQDQLFLVKILLQYRQSDLFDLGLNYIAHNGLWTTRFLPAQEPRRGPQFPWPVNNHRLRPYGSLNLSLSKYFPWGDRSLVLFLNANNILDQGNESDLRYAPDFSVVGREYFQRRSLYAGMVLKL